MTFTTKERLPLREPEPESWRGAAEAAIEIHKAASLPEVISAFANTIQSMRLATSAWVEIGSETGVTRVARMCLLGQMPPAARSGGKNRSHPYTSRLSDGRILWFHFEFAPDSRLSQQIILETLCEHLDIALGKLPGSEECFDSQFDSLSRREKEVFPHLGNGKSNAEIGTILGISHRTVEKHVSSILTKFGCESRICLLARFGRKIG